MTTSPIHGLPPADPRFTAIGGTGPAQHNLETSLHRASMSSSSHLHVIAPHVKTVAKVFNNPVFKQAIRRGGLTAGEAHLAVQKVLSAVKKEDGSIMNNEFKKGVLKSIVHGLSTAGAPPKQTPQVAKAIKMANLARRREANEEELNGRSGHAVSAADLVRQGHQNSAVSAYAHGINAPEHGVSAIAGQGHAATSISELMNKSKSSPPPSSGGGRPGGLPPRLAI